MVASSLSEARRCLREPVADLFVAASLLSAAADAELNGDSALCADLLSQSDLTALDDWIESLWGKVRPDIHRFREVPGSPLHLAKSDRDGDRSPSAALKRAVIDRDGHHCRFCGIPVIRREIRNRWKKRQPVALRWGRRNIECHAAFKSLWLQYDHVLPWTRGGRTDLENLIITCSGCNFGRMEWTLDEAGLLDPRTRTHDATWPGNMDWDGLERLRSLPARV
jgi:5-methylcytosine-specific restriction endonuclease McrA